MRTGRHEYGKGKAALGSPATMGPYPKYGCREADCKFAGKVFLALSSNKTLLQNVRLGKINKKKDP